MITIERFTLRVQSDLFFLTRVFKSKTEGRAFGCQACGNSSQLGFKRRVQSLIMIIRMLLAAWCSKGSTVATQEEAPAAFVCGVCRHGANMRGRGLGYWWF